MHILPKPKSRIFLQGACDISAGLDCTGLPDYACRFASALLGPETLKPDSPSVAKVRVLLEPGSGHRSAGAYCLEIGPGTIRITADDQGGVRNALASLSILARPSPDTAGSAEALRRIHCQLIQDYSDIAHRGVMLDVSRGKIPNRAKFVELVKFLATYKYTILQLYWEDCYILETHPGLGRMNGYYNRAEVAWMDALCAEHGIELQPNIQSYSHMHGILRAPGYGNLAELDTLFSFAAGNPAVYVLLDEILGEVLPWFSSRTVNLNMDEAYDLGLGYSKDAVELHGSRQVFLDHIHKVAAIARSHGANKIQIWGDKVAAYQGLQEDLDDDIVCIDWNYNPLEQFPSLGNFSAERKPFWIAPGTSSWNALFPRVQNASVNITNFIREGAKKGAEGVLMTHWGDYGHHQPISFSYHGFLYGAEQSWNAGLTPKEELDEAIRELFFIDTHFYRGFELLARTNLLASIQVGFKSQTIYAFFDDFLKGLTLVGDDHYPAIPESTFAGLQELGESAFGELSLADDSRILVREFIHAAHCIEFTGRKGLLSCEIRKAFETGNVDELRILEWIQRIRLLFREFCGLRKEFTRLWDFEAVDIGQEGALFNFDNAASRYAEAVIWLSAQRAAILAGHPVDARMSTYESAENYRTLWTGNCMNLWDRAYPWR